MWAPVLSRVTASPSLILFLLTDPFSILRGRNRSLLSACEEVELLYIFLIHEVGHASLLGGGGCWSRVVIGAGGWCQGRWRGHRCRPSGGAPSKC